MGFWCDDSWQSQIVNSAITIGTIKSQDCYSTTEMSPFPINTITLHPEGPLVFEHIIVVSEPNVPGSPVISHGFLIIQFSTAARASFKRDIKYAIALATFEVPEKCAFVNG